MVNWRGLSLRRSTLILASLLGCLLQLAATMAPASAAPVLMRAPLNPAFARAQKIISGHARAAAGHAHGYRPAPSNISLLQHARPASRSRLGGATLPTSYDLRTLNKLTAVRDQGEFGDCWVFATYGSLESYLLPGETWDFSENNMMNLNGFDLGPDGGGNYNMSCAYLARWSGPLTEAQDPYSGTTDNPSPTNIPPSKHVQDVLFLPTRASSTDNTTIKQAVMSYGAVGTSMYVSNGMSNSTKDASFNPATNAYYYNGSSPSDHAICIVGWDDNYAASNFSTAPPGPGAFIIRNSWGASWGENGYFYISYYDAVIGNESVAVFDSAESPTNYAHLYQYDPLGMVSSYAYTSGGNPVGTNWEANIFTAQGTETLDAFSTYFVDPSMSYDVYVYLNPSGGPISGATLADHETGSFSQPGYHTAKLTTPVALTAGQTFSIVLKLVDPTPNYTIPVQQNQAGYSSAATGQAGISYMSSNGLSWSDLYTGTQSMLCLKAFTVTGTTQPALSLTKQVTPTAAVRGTTLNYSLTYGCTGAGTTNTVLTDVLPANVTYVVGSASNSGAYNGVTNTLTWTLGALNAGSNATVTFQATVNATAPAGPISNSAAIASTEITTPVVSNTATANVTVSGGPALTLSKSVAPSSTVRGGTVTYTLYAGNNGTAAANTVVVTDVLPTYLNYVVGSATGGGVYNVGSNTLSWELGSLSVGASTQLTFQATVSGTAPAGTISNTADISSAEISTPVPSNTAAFNVTVGGTPALSLTKVVSPQTAGRGSVVQYTLTAGATGGNSTGVTLTDVLPANVTYVAGTASGGGTYNAASRTLTWALGALSAGSTSAVTFQATINLSAAIGSTITNTGSVASNEVPTPVTSNAANVTVAQVGVGDWAMFHHDPRRSGRTSINGPAVGAQKWAYTTTNGVISSAAFSSDGTIFVGSEDNHLYAFNPDGSVKWSYLTGGSINSSPAVGADGTVYVGSFDGNLYAINPDGTLQWSVTTPGGQIMSSPLLGPDGTVYIGSRNNKLYAVGPDGTVKWTFDTGQWVDGTPTMGPDGTIYVTNLTNQLFAINPDGSQKWVYALGGTAEYTAPTVRADGIILIGGADGIFYAINQNGVQKWAYNVGSPINTTAANASDGSIYFGADDHNLYALTSSGTLKWTFAAGAYIRSSPAIDGNGNVYFGSQDNKLYALNAGGTQLWAFNAAAPIESSPAIGADGTIYIGADNDKFFAITNGGTRPVLNLVKSVTPASTGLGGTVQYTLAISNAGTSATNVMLTDALPAHLTYVAGSATSGGTYNAGTNTLTWSLGAMNAGASAQVTFQATVNADAVLGSNINNSALAFCTQVPAPVTSNVASFTVSATSLSLTKAVTPSSAPIGGTVMYTLGVASTGSAAATNLTITDALPAHVTYVAGSATGGGVYNAATNTLTWSLGSMNAGASAQVTFQATVNADALIGSTINNAATVTCNEVPTPATSNVASFTVIPTPALTLTKSVAPSTVARGGTVTYTLNVGNTGTGAASVVTVTDQLSSSITFATGSVVGGTESYNAATGTLTVTVPTLAVGQTAPISFQATVNATAPLGGTILNAAFVSCAEVSTPVTSNTVSFTIPAAGPGRGDWWMFHHDPTHTGRSPFTGPGAAIKKWTFATGAEVESAPALGADGTIYVASQDDNLYAVNPDGTQKWAFTTGGVIHDSSPAVATDGTVYIGSGDDNLYAVNADGTLKWTFATGGAVDCPPTIGADGTVYFGSTDGKLYALNADGTPKWIYDTGGDQLAYSSPALAADGSVYIGSLNGKVYAVDATGAFKWSVTTGGSIFSTPAVAADGTIYVGSQDTFLYALNPDGTQQWTFGTNGGVRSSPAIGADGTIYVGSEDGNLYALNADGTQQWAYTTGDYVYNAPAIGADGTIYFGSQDKNIYALNGDGTLKWSYATGGLIFFTSPAIGADGTLYIGSDDHLLYAIAMATQPALALVKTVSPANTLPGNTVTYTLAYTNNGTAATGVTISDVLSANLTYVAGSASAGGAYDAPSNTLTWTLGALGAGQTGTVTFQAGVPAAVALGTTIPNQASIQCTEVPAPVASNTANLIIAGINDPPTIDPVPDQNVNENSPTQSVTLTGITPGDADDAGQLVTITATSNNPSLIPNPIVDYTNPNTTGTLYFTPVANANGSAVITLLVQDNGGTDNGGIDTTIRTFTINVGHFQPDLWIGATPAASIGQGIYNTNGSGQSISQTGIVGAPITSYLTVQNAGLLTDTFTLLATESNSSGWTVQYQDNDTGANVTAAMKTGTQSVTLGAGMTKVYRISATGATSSSTDTVQVTAVSTADPTRQDVVKTTADTGIAYIVTPLAGAYGTITPNSQQTVPAGGAITFSATANAGYTANTWAVDGVVMQTGGGTFSLTNIRANHTVQVMFKSALLTVTPSAGPNGAISPSTAQSVMPGGNLTFTARCNTGYQVDAWSVDGAAAQTGGATFTLTNIQTNHTVNVAFALIPPSYIVTPSAGANGAISPNTPQTVASGGSVVFTAAANAGYTADAWTVDGVAAQSGGATFALINITTNHTVNVTFKSPFALMVTPSAGTNGTISPATPQSVEPGGNLTFTASAATGYTVDTWLLDGTPAQAGGTQYQLANITANHAVLVTFKALTYTITPLSTTNGTLAPGLPQTVNYGGSLTLQALPIDGYAVDTWTLDGTAAQSGGATFTLSNITANHTVGVSFKAIPVTTHPADTNTDWHITIGELTAYAAAWKSGAAWPVDPATIPIQYVTNAGMLWQNGENYYYDSTQMAPNCWMPGIATSRGRGVPSATPVPTGNAARAFSAPITAWQPVTVSVTVTPAPGVSCYAVEETAPAGWTVSAISDGGSANPRTGKLQWGPFYGATPRVLSYTITPPMSAATGGYALNGTASFDGGAQPIAASTVQVGSSFQPDLWIRTADEVNYTGVNLYSPDGASQTCYQTVAGGATASYLFRVQNNGNATDIFTIKAPAGSSGWTVGYYDLTSLLSITSPITGGGWTTRPLAPGESLGFWVQIMPTTKAKSGDVKSLLVTATSTKDPTKVDAVKAVTTKQ